MIIRPESKTDLPKNIQHDMKLWRMGFGGMPLDYIKFHIGLAKKERTRLTSEYNLSFRENALVSDGWMDGMRVMESVVVTPTGREVTLRWNDGSQSFYLRKHGSSILSDKDLV